MKKAARFSQTKGFTLIEFFIAIAILAIFAGLSTPYLFGTKEKALLELERDKIVSALKIAQQNAIAAYKGYDHGIQFNEVNQQYTLISVDLNEIPPSIQATGKTTQLPSQIEITSLIFSPATEPAATLTFQRLTGLPVVSMDLTLTSRRFKVDINVDQAGMITSTTPERR